MRVRVIDTDLQSLQSLLVLEQAADLWISQATEASDQRSSVARLQLESLEAHWRRTPISAAPQPHLDGACEVRLFAPGESSVLAGLLIDKGRSGEGYVSRRIRAICVVERSAAPSRTSPTEAGSRQSFEHPGWPACARIDRLPKRDAVQREINHLKRHPFCQRV